MEPAVLISPYSIIDSGGQDGGCREASQVTSLGGKVDGRGGLGQ